MVSSASSRATFIQSALAFMSVSEMYSGAKDDPNNNNISDIRL
jgi:hypothetical protein